VKAKLGYPTLQEDIAVILEIRPAVGNEVAVMVDYNQCLTPTEAVQRILALDSLGLTWVEEPTLAHGNQGHASISCAVKTPIQCGENWWGPLEFRHAVEAKASDFVMPEVMKIGGVTGWRRAVAIAEAHSLRVSSHLWPEVSAQLLATTPMAHWLEYADWWNPIWVETHFGRTAEYGKWNGPPLGSARQRDLVERRSRRRICGVDIRWIMPGACRRISMLYGIPETALSK